VKPIKRITLLLSSLFLFACGSHSTASTATISPTQLQHEWVLINVDGRMINTSINSTIKISTENKASGNLACNLFFGELIQQGNEVKITKMGSTRKMCGADTMQVESTISNVLNNRSKVSLFEDKLTLTSKSHQLTYQLAK